MDDSALAKRLLQVEIAVASLSSDLRNHIVLCEARMKVLWKIATALSAGIALAVSVAVAFVKP